MANSSSSMDSLVSSGVDPKTAEALSKFVDKAVDQAVDKAIEKALRSLTFIALFRPQVATQNPASQASVVLTGIIALAAMVGVQLGAFYWLNDSIRNDMQAGFASMHDEFGRVRDEIGSVGADVGGLRAEIGELRERVIRIELLIEDRLP